MLSIRKIMLMCVLGVAAFIASPTTTVADDYWDSYWSWYDGTYRPYYYRQNTYPDYRGYRYYDDGGYYAYPRSRYYGTPNYGYRDYGRGRNYMGQRGSVQVGPLRFGWR
jgi:hypothetical protein